MSKSNRTKHCRTMKNIFSLLHLMCLFGPFLYFIPVAFITGTPVEKVSFGLTCVVAIIIGACCLIMDAAYRAGLARTITWILTLGILICLKQVETLVIILASVSILDEVVILPLYRHYKTALLANKEIDKRL